MLFSLAFTLLTSSLAEGYSPMLLIMLYKVLLTTHFRRHYHSRPRYVWRDDNKYLIISNEAKPWNWWNYMYSKIIYSLSRLTYSSLTKFVMNDISRMQMIQTFTKSYSLRWFLFKYSSANFSKFLFLEGCTKVLKSN